MAIARKCDRCGAFYDEYQNTKYFNNGRDGVNGVQFVHIDRQKYAEGTKNDTYDLCPCCLEAIHQYIKSKKEDSK